VFKIPRNSEFPAPLQEHIDSIKELAERLESIYTDAEESGFIFLFKMCVL